VSGFFGPGAEKILAAMRLAGYYEAAQNVLDTHSMRSFSVASSSAEL
jgi:hypothetical protein